MPFESGRLVVSFGADCALVWSLSSVRVFVCVQIADLFEDLVK